MCAFVATNKAPGVYIEEVQLPGPIAGVGTSTAAFVGPARRGELKQPVRLATWTEFVNAFGFNDDFGPYIPFVPIQVTSAVRGFFSNGGSDCWFVRVGTGVQASLMLKDRSAAGGRDTLKVKAQADGAAGNAISIAVQDASIASTTVARAEATINNATGTKIPVTAAGDAAKFVPEDFVFIDDGANSEWATVDSVNGTDINVKAPLTHTHASGTVRTDLAANQQRIRVSAVTGLEPGSYVAISQAAQSERHVIQAVEPASGFIVLADMLTNHYKNDAATGDIKVDSQEFSLLVGATEKFTNLAMDSRHSRYYASIVQSSLIEIAPVDPPDVTRPPDDMPKAVGPANLTGGVDDKPGEVTDGEFTAGIDALASLDEVNILCVPDATSQTVQAHMIAHCEALQDRFAILDPKPGSDATAIAKQRSLLGSDGGFAALYYPRIVVANPTGPGRITISPSGHLAGLYARVDNDRGVFKAPANEIIADALDLEFTLGDPDQGPLNEQGIDVIRNFAGRGVVVWGARTISQSTQWRYVNVRRLLLFIEKSLQRGTQFVVFEPNEPALWEIVKRQVTDFLTRQWTAGALVGATPDQGFSVRVDAELNPPSIVALGQLVIEVILFPAPPAEYVVFRIIQQPGGPVVQE